MFQGVRVLDPRLSPCSNPRLWPLAAFRRVTTNSQQLMKNFKKFVSTCVIVCITAAGFPLTAQARIVATGEVVATVDAAASRASVNQFLARDDVRQAMLGQGVTPQAAAERVAAMTDAEVAQLQGRMDQAPAGGDVLGVLFTVFIVLLVTDIMGLTKVFPFTRSVR